MCVCMCMYMYIYIYICIYVYMCVCIYMCMHVEMRLGALSSPSHCLASPAAAACCRGHCGGCGNHAAKPFTLGIVKRALCFKTRFVLRFT